MEYDYIIVGGGPSGLTCAQILTQINKKVMIIDREETLGGCHRVKRVEEKFTHHSPMVYTNASKNFINILKMIDYNFYDNFKPYKFSIFTIFNEQLRKQLNIRELSILAKDFILFIMDNNYLNDVSVLDYSKTNNFNEKTIEILDGVCRLSDGGDASRYSIASLFQLLNQNVFYSLYQPKKANDKGLFKRWENYLLERNVDITLNEEIVEIDTKKNLVNRKYIYKKLLLCIPPKEIFKLTKEKIERDISYNIYVSVTFHFDSYLNLEKHHGFSLTPWGVFWIVQTDYTEEKGTIISVTASILNVVSDFTKKTLNNTKDNQELIDEIFRQLNINFMKKIPFYDKAIINPNNYYKNNEWKCKDSAFLDIPDPVYINYSTNLKDVYYVGAFNGMTHYKPTSIEKAITNSINVINILEPESLRYFKVEKGFYLDKLIKITIIVGVIIVFVFVFIKR